jgi:hypothetical protein
MTVSLLIIICLQSSIRVTEPSLGEEPIRIVSIRPMSDPEVSIAQDHDPATVDLLPLIVVRESLPCAFGSIKQDRRHALNLGSPKEGSPVPLVQLRFRASRPRAKRFAKRPRSTSLRGRGTKNKGPDSTHRWRSTRTGNGCLCCAGGEDWSDGFEA